MSDRPLFTVSHAKAVQQVSDQPAEPKKRVNASEKCGLGIGFASLALILAAAFVPDGPVEIAWIGVLGVAVGGLICHYGHRQHLNTLQQYGELAACVGLGVFASAGLLGRIAHHVVGDPDGNLEMGFIGVGTLGLIVSLLAQMPNLLKEIRVRWIKPRKKG